MKKSIVLFRNAGGESENAGGGEQGSKVIHLEPNTELRVIDSNESDSEEPFNSEPDADGYYYPDEMMKALGIKKKVDDDEEVTYKIELSKGRTAIMRELTRKENNQAQATAGMHNKNAKNGTLAMQDRLTCAIISLATTFTDKDGKPIRYVMEDILEFKAKDSNRLNTACNLLHF